MAAAAAANKHLPLNFHINMGDIALKNVVCRLYLNLSLPHAWLVT